MLSILQFFYIYEKLKIIYTDLDNPKSGAPASGCSKPDLNLPRISENFDLSFVDIFWPSVLGLNNLKINSNRRSGKHLY